MQKCYSNKAAMNIRLVLIIITLFLSMGVNAGGYADGKGKSFAQEYAYLGILLEKVHDQQSAVKYKSKIAIELDKLKLSQPSGGDQFASLSEDEKKIFIKKFQNNHFHCGEVTKVMDERNRLLLNPATREVLGALLVILP
ncbi:MAG: hypothetical protein O6852_00580 [Gammaproteobacteria bacterium]|jgi:hypothetical protein|nr:hypothetical protein [Gammaproteobacteria bacterium]